MKTDPHTGRVADLMLLIESRRVLASSGQSTVIAWVRDQYYHLQLYLKPIAWSNSKAGKSHHRGIDCSGGPLCKIFHIIGLGAIRDGNTNITDFREGESCQQSELCIKGLSD